MWLNLIVGIILGVLGRVCSGVRCFCTEEHCSFGVCDSKWCLVGIKADGTVLRTCGNEAARMLRICRRNVGDWLEVCACDTPYCNTFAFLRHQIKYNRFADSPVSGRKELGAKNPSLFGSQREFEIEKQIQMPRDDQTAEYTRTRNGENMNFVKKPKETTVKSQNVSYLAVVLVIVPLSVGSAAVFLVAINYYCHLC